jgi:hypothetical protein
MINKQKNHLCNKKILIFFFIYKFLIFNFAIFFIITPDFFPDNFTYLHSDITDLINSPSEIFMMTGTNIVRLLGFLLNSILHNDYLVNFCFFLISFFGVAYLFEKIALKKNIISYLFIALFFIPSFNLFSSIASKEAILTMLTGILLGNTIFVFQEANQAKPIKFSLSKISVSFICLFFIILFKPLYSLFLFPFFLYAILLSYIFNPSLLLKILVIFFYLIFFIIIFYYFKDVINFQAHYVSNLFESMGGGSARINPFHDDPSYFTNNLFLNLLISLWSAPYITEINTFFQLLAFLESTLVCIIISFMLFFWFFKIFIARFSIEKTLILTLLIFMVLLAASPASIINAGAAIRFRVDIWLYLITFIYYFANNYKQSSSKISMHSE